MEPVVNTNNFLSGAKMRRDVSTYRRAYLDTYARRRAGLTDRPAQTQVIKPTAETAQEPQAQIPITEITVSPASTPQPEMQPPVVGGDMFEYTPVLAAKVAKAEEPARTSYLDTLSQRHSEAVASAPHAEDTVMLPSLDSETDSLLDEPELMVDETIEANLSALYGDYSLTSQLAKNSGSSASHVRTIVASSLACGVIALSIFGAMGRYSSQPVVAQPIDSPVIEVDASNVRTPVGGTSANVASIPQNDPSYPVRMLVGNIGINAPVESLGTTRDGLIDVPQSYGVVGWYNKGSVPGKPGPSILVGHYTGGNGGVFDKLKDLNSDDLITVTNGRGQTFTYKVTAKAEYEKDSVPMAELFKSSSDSKLQIITCSGKWQSKNYNKRLVVTAEIIK